MNQPSYHGPAASTSVASDLLTKPELADALRMSVRSLEILLKSGQLPAGVRRGRLLYWDASVVGKWHDEKFAAQRAWLPG